MGINFDYTIYFNSDSFHYGQGVVFFVNFNESAEDIEEAKNKIRGYVSNVIKLHEWEGLVTKVLIDQIYYTKFLPEFEIKS